VQYEACGSPAVGYACPAAAMSPASNPATYGADAALECVLTVSASFGSEYCCTTQDTCIISSPVGTGNVLCPGGSRSYVCTGAATVDPDAGCVPSTVDGGVGVTAMCCPIPGLSRGTPDAETADAGAGTKTDAGLGTPPDADAGTATSDAGAGRDP
jgi:hypothetical protein